MTEELEALVSHLYVVGGRAISAPPPGALVQLAPRRAPRGRERDAFFGLVLPTDQAHAQAVFYERMAQLAAERYFASGGGVTAGLREVLMTLNANLLEHNQEHPQQPFYADMVCLVLRQQDVYVAKSDGGLVLLWQDDVLETLPYDLHDPDLVNGQPLGYATEPEIKMAHYQVEPGDMAVLSDSGLAAIPVEALTSVGAGGDVQAVMGRLKAHNLPLATAMVLQFITADMPDPIPSAPKASREPSPAVSAQITSPAQPVSAAPSAAQSLPTPPAAAPVEAGSRRRFWQRGKAPDAAVRPAPSAGEVRAKPPRSLGDRLRGVWQRGRAGQKSLVGAAAAARPRLEDIQVESRSAVLRLGRRLLMLGRRGLLRLAGILGSLRRVVDKLLPEPEPGKPPSLPTPIAAGAAMLIPVAVVLLVVALALSTRDETAFERCLSQVREAVGAARLIDQNTPNESQDDWYGVMSVIDQCIPRRPDDPELLAFRDEALRRLDEYAGVSRCPMTPLRRYQPGTLHLRGPVLQGGVDLYVLDTERSTIYRETLNEAGNALVRDSEIIVERGSSVGEFVIRDLVDIAWLVEGGVARRSALVALDRNGVLLSYSPTFPPATAQALIGADRWIRPVAVDTWQGRLYILDPPANQIWRYQPTGGEYPGGPEEYFVGDTRPDLANAVDFAIDQTGNVYILLSDGSMLKYYSGEQQFFQFANLPSGGVGRLGSANAMYLDMGLISPGFYVMDAANQLLYETTLGGTFIRSYRAPVGTSFRDLSGLTVDASAENLYVLARDTLYHIAKCN